MGALSFDQDYGLENTSTSIYDDQMSIVEEIKDVIKVHKNGRVERPSNIQLVSPFLSHELNVTSRDVYIDRSTNIWARTYVPKCCNNNNNNVEYKLPLLVYFHGGGFCVGSTSWKCYHEFLGTLSSKSKCIIVSVNYRLAPENRLPGAYEDGIKALMWVKEQEEGPSSEYWTKYCDFGSIFLGGDNSGANIAYNVALKLGTPQFVRSIQIKGIILVQPLFGGEKRTSSEKNMSNSVGVSDTYWRLALPPGANRDHPWCNPIKEGVELVENAKVMVCIGENDVLRDRNLEFCLALTYQGNRVEHVVYEGAVDNFHGLDKSHVSLMMKHELISDLVNFIVA